MTRYRTDGPRDAFSQFIATGLAYVDYALSHRARFQLMFRSDRLDFGNDRLRDAAARSYAQLTETLAALPSPQGPRLCLEERAALAWSIVHGFATLTIENKGFAETAGGTPGNANDVLHRLLRASSVLFQGGTSTRPRLTPVSKRRK